MLLKDKFKIFRKELNLSQSDVAETLCCKVGKIKQIESGKTASISYADAKILEKVYRINEQWLRNNAENMLIDVSIDEFNIINEEFTNSNTILLPYYEDIKASAGTGSILLDSDKSFIRIPKIILPNSYDVLEVVSVYGDSMEPTFYDKDLIIIDRDRNAIINGKIFILIYEDELYVKRVFKMPNNKIILKSDNIFYPDIEIETDNFKIIGQVVTALNFKKLL